MKTVECAYADATGAGTAPLTWGQRFMWKVIVAADAGLSPFDLFLRHDFGEPLPLGAAVELLRAFVLRHPVLRMAIEVAADGRPSQRVRSSGLLRVSLCDSAGTDPEEVRDLIPGTTVDQMCQPAFLVAGDLVTGLALRINHLAADGYGVHLLSEDLAAAKEDAPQSPSPIALARFEGSADGAAVERRAIAFAEAIYRGCPPTMWPRRRQTPGGHRFVYGQLRSAALLAAVETLASGRGLSRAGVLVGAVAAVAASAAGLPSALMFTISNNRFDADWRTCPGQLSQEAILEVPVGPTLGGTMRAAVLATLRSLQAARYAPENMDALRRHVEWERGVHFDQLGSAIVLNLVTDGPTPIVDRRDDPEPSTFSWTGSTDQENLGLYLDAFPTATEFVLSARINTSLLSRHEAKEWLHAIEWAVVSTATGDVPTADLRARLSFADANAGADALRVGGEHLVAQVTGADAVYAVPSSEDVGGTGFVCYVVRPRRATTPREIHQAVITALPDAQPAVAPAEYVVLDTAPSDRSDPMAWSALPVRARGAGR